MRGIGYFYSHLFFPKQVKADVFILYGFDRKVDDFIDQVPQQKEKYFDFENEFYNSINGKHSGDIIISSFTKLFLRKDFKKEWVDSFLCNGTRFSQR